MMGLLRPCFCPAPRLLFVGYAEELHAGGNFGTPVNGVIAMPPLSVAVGLTPGRSGRRVHRIEHQVVLQDRGRSTRHRLPRENERSTGATDDSRTRQTETEQPR